MNIAKNIASRTLFAGKFLALEEIAYADGEGHTRLWESAVRTRSTPAVMIVPTIRPGDRLVLVRQFRPPTGKYVWEAPAGLIEPGESIETAALRELYEETGYTGTIRRVLPASFSSSGLSGESVHMVFVDIDGARYGNELPANAPDPGEQISVHPIARGELFRHLEAAMREGDAVDSKLLLYAHIYAD